MRPCDLKALEFDKILEVLARMAVSEPGRSACLALRPASDVASATRRLDLQADVARLTEEEGPLPLEAFSDLLPLLALARHEGALLTGLQLLEILKVVRLVRRVRTYLRRHARHFPGLAGIPSRMQSFPDLESALGNALDEEGRLKDQASPALAEIRDTIRTLRQELEARLKQLLYSPAYADVIAEHYVTVRNNRFVVPVRPHFAGSLSGIVQDRSASGETYFIEPLFAVEINNRQMIAVKEEEAEERRLLSAFTTQVGRLADEIENNLNILVDLDVLAAGALFARKLGCSKPGLGGSEVDLTNARHPLLVLTGRKVVPVNIRLAGGGRALVVSGPNTGGKTVALKTLGLLSLMAQTGLLIPAGEGSRLPYYRGVFADLGDEQSIERDLSTFSSHVANLVDIFSHLQAPALVLLDEPGVGTDPEDGALLAAGLLAALTRRQAMVMIATHYQPVKLLAFSTPNYEIAAVDFDPSTLEPRYRLVYGSVGESLALPVAKMLGMPQEVIEAAERGRSAEAASLGQAVSRMEEARRKFEEQARELERERMRAADAVKEHQLLAAELRERKRKRWQAELAEARSFLRELKDEGREVLAEMRRRAEAASRLSAFLREKQAEVAEREEEFGEPALEDLGTPAVGDMVEVVGKGIRGELVEVSGPRARIVRGGLRFEVRFKDLKKIGVAERKQPVVQLPDHDGVPVEINLMGARVSEALRRLENFLDHAQLAGHPEVRVIHGVGTGALKRAVIRFLSESPYCAAHREAEESAGGVTVVELIPQP